MSDVIPIEQSVTEPSPDLELVLRQYAPHRSCLWCVRCDGCEYRATLEGECQHFKWRVNAEEYANAGQVLTEVETYHKIARGDLFAWGYKYLRPTLRTPEGDKIEGVTAWAEYSAREWNCSQATIFKALEVAQANQIATIPAEAPTTLVYEVSSGIKEGESLDKAFQKVTEQGLNTWKVRLVKQLRKRKLIKGWELPTLHLTHDDQLVVKVDGHRRVIGRITNKKGTLAKAGLYLLLKGMPIREEKPKEK